MNVDDDFFLLFSSVKLVTLKPMQISHGMSYIILFLIVSFSNTCTFDIALQSVADKIVREISLKAGKSPGRYIM